MPLFDSEVQAYDAWYETPAGQKIYDLEYKAISYFAKNIGRSLEVGVGTARFSEPLKISVGMDISFNMLQFAQARNVNCICGNAESLPFADESFDTIFLLFTLGLVRDAQECISEITRCLRSGGHAIISFINPKSPLGKSYLEKQKNGHRLYKHTKFYTYQETLKMIEENNLSVTGVVSTLFSNNEGFAEKVIPSFQLDAGCVVIDAQAC